jgi:AhpD family alkylhydroperoxidase
MSVTNPFRCLSIVKTFNMERILFSELPKGFYPALKQVQDYVDNSGLDHAMLKLIRIRVSQINGCAYCLDMHSKDGILEGETLQRMISVSAWRETTYYSPQEKAALAFAERLTLINIYEHNDDIHDELSNHFTRDEIAHLTLAITQINTWNRIVKSFGTTPGSYQPAKKQAHSAVNA